jgi:hypothetical protein
LLEAFSASGRFHALIGRHGAQVRSPLCRALANSWLTPGSPSGTPASDRSTGSDLFPQVAGLFPDFYESPPLR